MGLPSCSPKPRRPVPIPSHYNKVLKTLTYTIDTTVAGPRTANHVAAAINAYSFGGGQAFTVQRTKPTCGAGLTVGGGAGVVTNER